MSNNQQDHAWVHEQIAAAVAGGLTAEEQARFDAHVHSCAECFDAFAEARDADRAVQRALDSLTPSLAGERFEDRVVTAFREQDMKTQFHPLAKRAGFAIAAAVALAATGVFAQYVVHGDFLNNPVSKQLGAQNLDLVTENIDGLLGRPKLIQSVSGGDGGFSDALPAQAVAASAPPVAAAAPLSMTDGERDGKEQRASLPARFDPPYNKPAPQQALKDDSAGIIRSRAAIGGHAFGGTGGGEAYKTVQSLEGMELGVASSAYYVPEARRQVAALDSDRASGEVQNEQVARQLDEKVAAVDTDRPAAAPPPAAATQPASDAGGAAADASQIAERKIIRNGTVEFEVRSFDDAFATISSVVGEEGGFVSSTSSDKLANGKVRGEVVVRVPPEHLDRLLLKLRALGDLKSQRIGANDITKEYTDLESELRALRAMESRMIDIIKTGNGQVKDLVVAEKQLGEYRVRIEKIEGDIRYYNNLVGMATLTITAYEKDIQTPTAAQEQENVALSVETEDVEAKYADARKIVDDAKGRIIESDLKKHDAGEYAAEIVAEVPPEKADFVAAQLKQLGVVATFTRDRKQTTTGGNGAPTVQVVQKPTRFSISLYNLANIAPRETAVLTIAVRDVEGAYKTVLAAVRKEQEVGKGGDGQPKPIGRVVTSNLSGQQQDQMTADIRADVTAGEADKVLESIRALGEVMNSSLTENPDTANVTSAKRGIQLRIVNIVAVPARESRSLSTVAAQVPEAYGKLVGDLQSLEETGGAHILTSQLNQSDPRTVNATLAFDVRRDALPAIDKAFAEAGIDILSRNVTRSNDTANTLDTKVHFQIDSLQSADTLPPRRTTTLGIEADNVEKALGTLRGELDKEGITHIQYSVSKEASGRVTGHVVVDVPVGSAMTVLGQIRDMGGEEKVDQVVDDPGVPETRFAKERMDLTVSSRESIVGEDRGIGATVRAALGSAAAVLLWSLYLIVMGAILVGPWLGIGWLWWRISRRRKGA
jgi:anti-sigma factor RsiW